MSSWRIDVSPLRTSRDFRLLFSAGVAVGASAHSGGGECRPAGERVQR